MGKKLLLVFAILLGWILAFSPVFAEEPYDQSFTLELPLTIEDEELDLSLSFSLRNQAGGSANLTIAPSAFAHVTAISVDPAKMTETTGTICFSPEGHAYVSEDEPGIRLCLTVGKDRKWSITQETVGYKGSIDPQSGTAVNSGTAAKISSEGSFYEVRDILFKLKWVDASPDIRPDVTFTLQHRYSDSEDWQDVEDAPAPEITDEHFIKNIIYRDMIGLNITVTKVWDDDDNWNHSRPDVLPVYLLAHGSRPVQRSAQCRTEHAHFHHR